MKLEGIPDIPEAYDKMSVVLITLDGEKDTEEPLLRMLNTLLSPLKSAGEKKKLEEDFHAPTHKTGGDG